MMISEGSIEIRKPIEEVFTFTTQHVEVWSLAVVSDQVIEEKPGMVGTTFRVTTESRGNAMEFDGVVTGYDPPNYHSVSMKGRYFDIDVEYFFEESGTKTRVTQKSIVHPKGMFRILFLLFGWLMKKTSCDAVHLELDNLRQILEDD